MIIDRRHLGPGHDLRAAFPVMDGGAFRSEINPGTMPDDRLLFYAVLAPGGPAEPWSDRDRRMLATLELRRRQHMEAA